MTNYTPPTYPNGLDISVFNFKSLFSAWKNAKTDFDKEHVVPFLLQNSKYKKINITHDEDLNLERWTLDEPEDLVVLNNIFTRFKGNFNFSWLDVLKNKKKFPEDFMANKNIKRDEGSILNDGQKLWKRALKIVKTEKKASTSFLQRKLQIGYNRAARIIEQMEDNGVVSKANHVGKREVL